MKLVCVFVGIISVFAALGQSLRHAEVKEFTDNVFHLSEVMLHDVANPPAAGRFYAYF